MPRVTIKTRSRESTHEIRAGLGFQALAAQTSTALEFDCREADCGICIMRVTAGMENLSEKTREEADFLKAMHADPNERLACQCRIMGDVVVELDEP